MNFKLLKNITLVALVLLLTLSIILVALGSLVSIFVVAFLLLFLYYLVVFIALTILDKKEIYTKGLFFLLLFFLLLPIVWLFFDSEGLINFLMQGVSLDMK